MTFHYLPCMLNLLRSASVKSCNVKPLLADEDETCCLFSLGYAKLDDVRHLKWVGIKDFLTPMSCCEYGRFKFGLTQHRPIDQDHKSVLKITNMRYIITFNVLRLDMYSGFFLHKI